LYLFYLYCFRSTFLHIIIVSTWYQSHKAFNVLTFSHVPSNNLNAQVHHHASPKSLCQFNIMRVTHCPGSVRRFNKRPSGLIFFLFVAQVGPFYVLALAIVDPFEVWPFVNLGPLSALFGFWPVIGLF
jgi:hypothetical protein